MENYTIVLLIMAPMIGASGIADRIKLPVPILLLVFLTTIGIAAICRYMIPGMSWPLTFVLGAILSASDAVAAVGITKGLGLPHKTLTILEGESLVNDASALVAYRCTVAAVTGIAFVFFKSWLQFLIVLGGGFLVLS